MSDSTEKLDFRSKTLVYLEALGKVQHNFGETIFLEVIEITLLAKHLKLQYHFRILRLLGEKFQLLTVLFSI